MAILTCQKCGTLHRGASVPACVKCGAALTPGAAEGSQQQRPWPAWAKWISERRTEGEVGVGDTLERLLAKFGGRVLKKMMESVGLPCGCDKRQLDYNTIYSYEQLQDRNQPDE